MLADRAYMREPTWRRPRLSVTIVLMAVSLSVFLLKLIGLSTFGPASPLALTCDGLAHGLIFQLITYQFLHGNFLHLLFNMVTLWFFGRVIEDRLGSRRYLELYFASGIIGGLLQVSLGWIFPASFGEMEVVGASASICGLIAAFAALDPEQLVLFFFFIPMRAKWLFYISLGISLIFALVPGQSGIAHAAHLGGLIAGWAYIRLVLPGRWRLPGWPWFRPPSRKIVKLPRPANFLKASSPRRRAAAAEDLPPAEFISREVDPILDKISAHGIQSLTEHERKILEAARERMGRL